METEDLKTDLISYYTINEELKTITADYAELQDNPVRYNNETKITAIQKVLNYNANIDWHLTYLKELTTDLNESCEYIIETLSAIGVPPELKIDVGYNDKSKLKFWYTTDGKINYSGTVKLPSHEWVMVPARRDELLDD